MTCSQNVTNKGGVFDQGRTQNFVPQNWVPTQKIWYCKQLYLFNNEIAGISFACCSILRISNLVTAQKSSKLSPNPKNLIFENQFAWSMMKLWHTKMADGVQGSILHAVAFLEYQMTWVINTNPRRFANTFLT